MIEGINPNWVQMHLVSLALCQEAAESMQHLKFRALYPANTRLAQLHRRISKFGERPAFLCQVGSQSKKMYPYLKGEEMAVCPCCQVGVCVRQLGLCMETKPVNFEAGQEKYKLNSDVTLFFFFIKMSIFYLLLRFLVTDSYNIYSSMQGHYCTDSPTMCANLFNSYLSGYNKHTDEDHPHLQVMNTINILMTSLSLLFCLYNRKVQYNLFQMLDQTDITQDDFSIWIENIPQIITTQSPLCCDYQQYLNQTIDQKLKKWLLEGDPRQDQLLKDLLRCRWIQKLKNDRKQDLEENIFESFRDISTNQIILHDIGPKISKNFNSLRKKYSYDINDNDIEIYQQRYREHLKEKYDKELKESVQLEIQGKQYPRELQHLPNVVSISLCYDLTQIESLNRSRDHFVKKFVENTEVSNFLVDQINKDVDELQKTRILEGGTDETNQLNFIDTFRESMPAKIKSGKYSLAQIKYLEQIAQHFQILDEFDDLCISLNQKYSHERSAMFNQTKFVGKAFVTFQYQHMRQYFIRETTHNPSFLKINGQNLKTAQPPQPGDVFWYNLKISHDQRFQSIIFSVLVLLMCIGFSFVCVIIIEQKQLDSSQAELLQKLDITRKMISNAYNVGMSMIVVIINALLSYIIEHLTDLERHKTQTKRIASLVIKNVLSQFLNTCVIYYTLDKLNGDVGPLEENGLISKIMFLVGIGALITISMNLLLFASKVTDFMNSIQGKLKYKEKRYVNAIQEKLNKERECPEFNFVTQYTFYLVQLYIVSFYSLIAPATVIFMIAVFTVQYWVDKYNLFRKCSVHVTLNFQLFKLIILLFEFSLLIDVVGNLVFDDMIDTKKPANQTKNMITLILVCCYLVVMMFAPDFVKKKLLKKEVNYQFSYYRYLEENAVNRTYWSDNPATALADRRKSHFYNRQEEKIRSKINFLKSTNQINRCSKLSQDSFYVERYTQSDVKVYNQYFG